MSDATGIQDGQAAKEANFTGFIFPYAGGGTPPGFLLCDGSAVSRTTYARLFAVIGTTYGAGDGSTTFNLPDSRGRAFIGAGSGTKVGTFVSRSGNVITISGPSNKADNEFQTGQAVTYHSSSTVITGLTNDTLYYLIRTGNLTFSLAATLSDAQNGVAISLSSDGAGTQTFTLALSTRARGDYGGEESHAMSITELIAHIHAVYRVGGSSATSFDTSSHASTSTVAKSTESTGGNAAMNNMVPFFVGNWMIKT